MTDDLSTNLVRYMPEVQRMEREGVSFANYYVADSLCCPSRASMLTGRFPHDTGVLNNTPPDGGFPAFRAHGDERQTYATVLHDAGYRTAYMGKYLNGYKPGRNHPQPGWSDWVVAGSGYDEFDYKLNVNGHVERHGHRPSDYLTDVLSRRADAFVARAAAGKRPFLLTVGPFAPHYPFVPAPRDRNRFPGLHVPRSESYDAAVSDPPAWLGARPPLTDEQKAETDRIYRLRAQSVLAVNRLLLRLRRALERAGVARNTYVVFTSDNGFHTGEHRLTQGKMTAFDSDIRVPFVVTGPGIQPATTNAELIENTDVAPTLIRLGGASAPRTMDGHGFVSLLHDDPPERWRDAVLVEHHGPTFGVGGDPDVQPGESGNPPRYVAIRTRTGTWVEYADGQREYYDDATDPAQLHNIAGSLSAATRASLHRTLVRLVGCHHTLSCWRAARR